MVDATTGATEVAGSLWSGIDKVSNIVEVDALKDPSVTTNLQFFFFLHLGNNVFGICLKRLHRPGVSYLRSDLGIGKSYFAKRLVKSPWKGMTSSL